MKAIIQINDMGKSFNHRKLFDSMSLDIFNGETVALVGRSGAGKTTLLNIMSGLETFDSGSVSIFDIKLQPTYFRQRSVQSLYIDKIAFVFQQNCLIQRRSIAWNLSIPLKANKVPSRKYKDMMQQVLRIVGLDKDLSTLVCSLSGGEQQRLALARALIKPFEVILLDEPTSSLDKESKAVVIDVLTELKKERKTIVVATHDDDVVKICERMVKIG